MQRLRVPAWSAPAVVAAQPVADDPSAALVDFYARVWREQMQELPFVNPALAVEAVGFRRYQGDWVGIVVTPWFVNLLLLPGGGALWHDLPAGEQRAVDFPVGRLEFIADRDPVRAPALAAFQYCPLIHPVQHLASPAMARQAAEAALAALLVPPAAPAEAPPAAAERSATSPPLAGRRGFLRQLTGRRGES